MPSKSANVENEQQYEALRDEGMSKQRVARSATSPDVPKHGGEQSGTGGNARQRVDDLDRARASAGIGARPAG